MTASGLGQESCATAGGGEQKDDGSFKARATGTYIVLAHSRARRELLLRNFWAVVHCS